MKDLSLHLLDILENSAMAGARRVTVTLSRSGTWLHLDVTDNGPGLAPEVRADPTDPFCTTRRERKVGLGLGLLRRAAEQTGGSVTVAEAPGGGVSVTATFDLGHIDAKPLGDLEGALLTAIAAWPDLALCVRTGDDDLPVLDTAAVQQELPAGALAHPEVREFLRRELRAGLQPLTDWAADLFGQAAARLAASQRSLAASAVV